MKMRSGAIFIIVLLLSACGSAPSQPKAFTEGERLLRKGVTAYHNDELPAAAGYFNRALLHYQGLDDRDGELRSHVNLIEVSLAVGNLDAARRHLAQAESLAVGELAAYQPRLLLLRSSLALAAGDTALARQLSESLLPQKLGGRGQVEAAQSLQRQAMVNRTAAAFATTGDDPAVWVERLGAMATGDPLSESHLARFRAELARRKGDTASANGQLQRALDLCKAIPARNCIASTLEEWGAMLLAGGDLKGAAERYQRALAVRMVLLDRPSVAADLHQLANISQGRGEQTQAATYRQWAEAMAGSEPVEWNRLRRETSMPQ